MNRQNGFRTKLERLSCHKCFKITQAPTEVSFFYINPLLQVEFRTIFEPFSYILLQNTQYCHVCKSQTTSGPPAQRSSFAIDDYRQIIGDAKYLRETARWIFLVLIGSEVYSIVTYFRKTQTLAIVTARSSHKKFRHSQQNNEK